MTLLPILLLSALAWWLVVFHPLAYLAVVALGWAEAKRRHRDEPVPRGRVVKR